MVTRSIVGRFLILAVLLVSLGVIAQAALIITKDSGKKVVEKANAAPSTATGPSTAAMVSPAPAGAMTTSAAPASTFAATPAMPVASVTPASVNAQPLQATDAAPVRVVYPGPLGDAPILPRKIADAAPASPIATAPVPSAPVAAVQPAPLPAADAAPKPAAVQVASAEPGATVNPAVDPVTSGKGINLNSASVEALNHLGGGHIGQSIVQHRPYRSIDDLVKKRVVRRSVFEQIKNQVAAE